LAGLGGGARQSSFGGFGGISGISGGSFGGGGTGGTNRSGGTGGTHRSGFEMHGAGARMAAITPGFTPNGGAVLRASNPAVRAEEAAVAGLMDSARHINKRVLTLVS